MTLLVKELFITKLVGVGGGSISMLTHNFRGLLYVSKKSTMYPKLNYSSSKILFLKEFILNQSRMLQDETGNCKKLYKTNCFVYFFAWTWDA